MIEIVLMDPEDNKLSSLPSTTKTLMLAPVESFFDDTYFERTEKEAIFNTTICIHPSIDLNDEEIFLHRT